MAEHRGTIDRRTLLQLMGAAGASAIVMSGGGTPMGEVCTCGGLGHRANGH